MTILEQELTELKSFDAGNDLLARVTLHPSQIVDALKMLYSKRAILRYDTGTGKTLVASAVIKMLYREDSSRRFLMFIKKDQCIQTPRKMTGYLNLPVISSCAADSDVRNIILSGKYLDYPVVLLTYECLHSQPVMKDLFKNRSRFCCVLLDEAHTVNNVGYAKSADMMAALVSQFEYCFALTATPFLTNPLQFAKLACIVDPQRFSNYNRLGRSLSKGTFKIEDAPLFFINRTAEEMGRHSRYCGHVVWVEAMPHQKVETGGDPLMQLCKGEGAVNQVKSLINVIKAMEGKLGLVYIRQHAVREWVIKYFNEAGIRYECINGHVVKERPQILERFNEKRDLDVLITSVTTAIDADCDYVCFYEFTVELKQMIGRADRGLDSKRVDIFYFLTRDSSEVDYFREKIIARSELAREILGVSIQEVEGLV